MVGKQYMDKVYLDYDPGDLKMLWIDETSGARSCGIGKILTRLCMEEEKTHDVGFNNFALDYLRTQKMRGHPRYSEIGAVISWMQSKCKKVICLSMEARESMSQRDSDRAIVYFKAAKLSGFTQMIVVNDVFRDKTYVTYPEDGPCSIEEIQKKYKDGWAQKFIGHHLGHDLHQKVDLFGRKWFFCYPKGWLDILGCTIL